MADTFTQDEHSDLARHLMERSVVHFEQGEPLEGAETLWGAAAHALIAVALSESWRYDSHGALKRVALRLPDIPGQPEWHSEFNAAEKFHIHFYHGRLTDRRIADDRPKVRRFALRLLAYIEGQRRRRLKPAGLLLNCAMRFPWANILLLALVVAELVTGYLGLTHSNPEWLAAMHLHRIFGFAILALFLWKARNIFASLRSPHNWRVAGREMIWSLLLLAGLLATIGLGLAWSNLGPYHWLGFSGVTIHLNLGWLLIPLLLWHTLRHRISLRRRYLADRRHLLRAGALALAGFLLWRATELAGILSAGPGATRRATGSYPENGPDFPVTMWLNDRIPYIDPAQWRLRVGGYVEQPYELDIAELMAWSDALTATLDCTGGWYTTRRWEGVPAPALLARARPRPGAGSITIRSRTGYFRRYSMDEAGRALLACRVDGAALTAGHGFPARMVEPHKRGYDWVKWVDSITVNDTGKLWQPPLPLT